MKVFIDTNILVSALTTRGMCWELLETVVDEHEVLTSEIVLKEFNRILTDKFNIPPIGVSAAIKYIHAVAVILPMTDNSDPPVAIPDPDDAPIIASALAAGAEVFITGDKALLDLKAIGNMAMLSPRDFWVRERGG